MTINKKGVQTDTLFVYGGGGNRTRVREPSVYASYRFSPDLISSSEDPRDRDSDNQPSVDLILPAAGALEEPSHNFTPHQDPWEKSCETSLLFKQRVRSCLRHLIYVQGLLRGSCDLDLRRWTSNSPSKPIRPHLSRGRYHSPSNFHLIFKELTANSAEQNGQSPIRLVLAYYRPLPRPLSQESLIPSPPPKSCAI